jgi:hypothetical protein
MLSEAGALALLALDRLPPDLDTMHSGVAGMPRRTTYEPDRGWGIPNLSSASRFRPRRSRFLWNVGRSLVRAGPRATTWDA